MGDDALRDLTIRLYAELDGIRRRAQQITDEHEPDQCDLGGETCTGHDAERMLGALELVISYHTTPQTRRRKGRLVCAQDSELMPCLMLQYIARDLFGGAA